MTGTHYAGQGMDIPTTSAGTALNMGNVGTAGVAVFKNLDATYFIELGIQTGGVFFAFAKLKPGESFPIRLGTNTPYARANTATCVLDYQILED
jgi:hypothetical protein